MLDQMSLDAIDAKGQWDKLHAEYMRFYLCQPKQDIRTFPWFRANNFFAPVVRSHVDSFNARMFDSMFATMPRVIGIEGSDIEDAELLSLYYFDFLWNGPVLNLRKIASNWNFDTNLDGTGVVKNRWSRDMFLQRVQAPDTVTSEKSLGEEFAGQPLVETVTETELKETARVKREELPVVETAPVSRLYPAPGSGPSMQWPECPWFFEDVFRSEADLRVLGQQGFEHMDELAEMLKEHEITDSEREQQDYEELGSRQLKKARLRFFFMRLALPGQIELIDDESKSQEFDSKDGFAEEVIVTYLPDMPMEKRVSKVVPLARLRGDNRRPYIDNRYNTLPRVWFGQGMAAKLRKIQTQTNVAFRQMADFGTLRNMPWGLYNPHSTGLLKPNALKPGAMVPVQDPRGVQFASFSGDHAFQVAWLQLLDRWAERDTAVTDFSQGRTSSQPNAPRTARGTMALLQQSEIQFNHRVSLFVEAYKELFQQVHELHKFNSPEELPFRVLNRKFGTFERRTVNREVFQQELDFQFEINPNRLQDQQNNFQLAELFANYLPLMQQFPPAREFFAKVYKSFGNKDIDTILPPELFQQPITIPSGQELPGGDAPPNGGDGQATPAPERDPEDEGVKL